jgi:hypothetical protein
LMEPPLWLGLVCNGFRFHLFYARANIINYVIKRSTSIIKYCNVIENHILPIYIFKKNI